MPRRGPDWVPKLTHVKRSGRGRVRFPGRSDVYLGPPGCWPARQRKPPPVVLEQYHREVAKWQTARAEGAERQHPRHPSDCTVNQLAALYRRHCLAYYRKRGKPTSEVNLIGQAVRQLRLLFGSTLAADVRPKHLAEVRDAMCRSGRCDRDTVNAYLSRIRRMFRWAAAPERALVPEEVWLRLRAVEGPKRGRVPGLREREKVGPPDPAAVAAVINVIGEPGVSMIRFQRLTGCRPEEACGLRLCDLHQDGDLLRYDVPEAWNKMAHKGSRRSIYLGGQACGVLLPWLAKARAVGRETRVFRGPRGSWSPGYYCERVRDACRAAGLPESLWWTPNQLRHERGTLTRQRYGLEGAAAQLGHTQLETSAIYAEKDEELARRIARETG